MIKITTQNRLLIILVLIVSLAGCKDDGKRKALAEAAQARAEVVKLKAETVQLKSEVSYLNEKLAAAERMSCWPKRSAQSTTRLFRFYR